MIPVYTKAIFGDDGFVEISKSDDEDFLLNIKILVNVTNMTVEEYEKQVDLLENYFIFDETRHPLSVTATIKIDIQSIGNYGK